MNYDAWFQCSEGCDETYPLTEIIYRCKNCDGLLEVQHNMDVLKQRSAADWKSSLSSAIGVHNTPMAVVFGGKRNLFAQTLMIITSSLCMRAAPICSGQNASASNSAYTTCGSSSAGTAIPVPLKTSG